MGGGGGKKGQKKKGSFISSQTSSSLPRRCFSIATQPKGSISPLGEIIIISCTFGGIMFTRFTRMPKGFHFHVFFLPPFGRGSELHLPAQGIPVSTAAGAQQPRGGSQKFRPLGFLCRFGVFFALLSFFFSHSYNPRRARRSSRGGGKHRVS